jgi:adenylate cyclase
LAQAAALYDRRQHHALTAIAGFDAGLMAPFWQAIALWTLGYPDQALKANRDVLALAYELSHSLSLAYTLGFAAPWLYQLRREARATQELTEAGITLSTEKGFPMWAAWGTTLRGWALTEQGEIAEGMIQIREGIAAHRATGANATHPQYLALLANGYRQVGQLQEGLSVLDEALAQVAKTGERYYEAELYRLRGELILQSNRLEAHSNREEAEACFLRALEIARQQQAKSLELRAVMSLARLWQQQGKKDKAHKLLSEIYGWFTEGFDTKDLQEAKALLAELEAGH